MTKEFRLALEALARVAGRKLESECTYCGRAGHSECEGERHEIVTFVGPAPEGEEE